jgi:RimJ/RimL family protein N-acetyltransferase
MKDFMKNQRIYTISNIITFIFGLYFLEESMFNLNIHNDYLFFRDIKVDQLSQILDWYNKVEDFKFATGIDTPITLDILMRKYAEVAICKDEFFVGIYIIEQPRMIGILKGRLKYKSKDTVWISSIVIEPASQNKGFGSMAIHLLLEHLKMKHHVKSVYLAVIEENIPGRSFWFKNNFLALRKIENHLKLQERHQNVIIMHKEI